MKHDRDIESLLFQMEPSHKSKASNEAVDPNGYKVVSVRLREPEFVCFAEQVRFAGLTNNQALRIAARRIAGFLETDAQTRALLTEISGGMSAISQALNQIKRQAALSGTVDMEALAQERLAFGQQFVRLEEKLRVVLNVSMRRQDGMALLKKAERL